MIKAVVTHGMIVPRERLPEDWREGTEVTVAKLAGDIATQDAHPADVWMDEVEAVARAGDAAADHSLATAIENVRRREKELARKKLDLEP
jgi:hypothetical protein